MRRWSLIVLAAVPSPALANWQYTHWGMSVDEVMAAANGSAKRMQDDPEARVLEMPRLIVGQANEGEAVFGVEFYFKANRLSLIRYQPTGAMDCPAEETFLLGRFGPADSTETTKDLKQELKLKNSVLLKTRKRLWTMPSGDNLTFHVFRIERPDLPDVQSKPRCNVLIQPNGQ